MTTGDNGLSEIFVDMVKNPQKQIEKRDRQIDEIFDVSGLDEKYRKKIKEFFKVVGSRVKDLKKEIIELIARQLKYLGIEIEDSIENKRCNDIIAGNFIMKIRACYMELGIDPNSISYNSDEQKTVIDSLTSIEKTRILSQSDKIKKEAREKELNKFIEDDKDE